MGTEGEECVMDDSQISDLGHPVVCDVNNRLRTSEAEQNWKLQMTGGERHIVVERAWR